MSWVSAGTSRSTASSPIPPAGAVMPQLRLPLRYARKGVSADNVQDVEIRLSQSNWLLVHGAYDADRDSIAHAQFNASYGFAQALVRGEVGLRAYTRPAIGDPAVVNLTRRTRVVSDPTIDPGAIAPATVIVTLDDGGRVIRQTSTLKGDPAEPMSDEETVAKLRDCFAFGLGAPAQAADRVASAVFDLEHATDVGSALCTAFRAADQWEHQ